MKSLEAPTRRRGLRTLDLFVKEWPTGLTDGSSSRSPKVTSVEQVEAMVFALETSSSTYGRPQLKFEIQVETPQAILGSDGTALIARMVKPAAGARHRSALRHLRLFGLVGVAAAYQSMEHPVADHAKDVMQLAAAGTGVFVSDGSTNVLPVGDAGPDALGGCISGWYGVRLPAASIRAGTCTRPSSRPASRDYLFYREGLDQAARRLRAYLGHGESGYLDEPATAAALAGFVLRGIECGAVDTTEFDTADLARLARRA